MLSFYRSESVMKELKKMAGSVEPRPESLSDDDDDEDKVIT